MTGWMGTSSSRRRVTEKGNARSPTAFIARPQTAVCVATAFIPNTETSVSKGIVIFESFNLTVQCCGVVPFFSPAPAPSSYLEKCNLFISICLIK